MARLVRSSSNARLVEAAYDQSQVCSDLTPLSNNITSAKLHASSLLASSCPWDSAYRCGIQAQEYLRLIACRSSSTILTAVNLIHSTLPIHTVSSSKTSAAMGFMLKAPAGTPGSAAPAIMIGLFVAFGGVLFGFVTALSVLLNPCLTHAQLRYRYHWWYSWYEALEGALLHWIHQREGQLP